jgi:heat shock protein HslJ
MTQEPQGEAGRRRDVRARPTAARLALAFTLAVAVAFAFAVAGCGGDDDDTATGDGSSGAADQLAGRTFQSSAVTEDGQPRPLADGTQIRLRFDDGRVSADAGCNTMTGTVEITDDRLVIDEMGMTAMGCEPPLGDQDEWLQGVLFGDPGYTLDGAELRLESGTTVIELTDREVADPDRPLEATTWALDGIVDGDAVSSVPAGGGATVVFADGQVSVDVEGCNQGGGDATIGDGTIELGALRTTRIACPSPAAEIETAVTAVLDGEITYAIEADVLTLTHPSGRGLTLRATG